MIDPGEVNLRALRGWPLLTHAEWVSLCDPARAHELEEHFLPCPLHLIGLLPDDAADARHLLQGFGTRPAALREEEIGDAAERMIAEQDHGRAHEHDLTIPPALLWHLARLHLLVQASLAWGPERISESRQLSPLLRRELSCAVQTGVKQGLSFLGPLLNLSAPHVNVSLIALLGAEDPAQPDAPDDEVALSLLSSVRTVLGRRAPSVEETPVQATLNAFLATIHAPRSTP